MKITKKLKRELNNLARGYEAELIDVKEVKAELIEGISLNENDLKAIALTFRKNSRKGMYCFAFSRIFTTEQFYKYMEIEYARIKDFLVNQGKIK